jgi:hypothetical protein
MATLAAPAPVDFLLVENVLQEKTLATLPEYTTTSTNGTLILTVNSSFLQILTGTATGYSIVLPDATTLINGWRYEVENTSNQTILIKNKAGTLLLTISAGEIAFVTLQSNSTLAGTWIVWSIFSNTANGILNYTLDDQNPFVTSVRSPSYDLITGFSLTPQAGKYSLWYNASVYYTTTPKAHWWAFYKAGVQETGSIRTQDTAHSNQNMVDNLVDVISFNGSESIDVRVSCDNTGTLTVNSRTLVLIRLGP